MLIGQQIAILLTLNSVIRSRAKKYKRRCRKKCERLLPFPSFAFSVNPSNTSSQFGIVEQKAQIFRIVRKAVFNACVYVCILSSRTLAGCCVRCSVRLSHDRLLRTYTLLFYCYYRNDADYIYINSYSICYFHYFHYFITFYYYYYYIILLLYYYCIIITHIFIILLFNAFIIY